MNKKMKFSVIYTTAILSILTVSSANADVGDIVNAGFEKRFDGWADKEPSAISSEAYSGEKSAKIMEEGGRFEQVVEVKKNTNYELSAYIKGAGKIGVEMDGTFYSNMGGGKDFEKVVVSFNSGDATSVTVFAHFYKNEGRFDNFKLKNKDRFWPF